MPQPIDIRDAQYAITVLKGGDSHKEVQQRIGVVVKQVNMRRVFEVGTVVLWRELFKGQLVIQIPKNRHELSVEQIKGSFNVGTCSTIGVPEEHICEIVFNS